MTPSDPRALRDAFGTFMTGVTVITALDHADHGRPIGFTANSFTSVSLDPALVLVCLARESGNIDAFMRARGFAVNVLSETQTDISNVFASPLKDRFKDVGWQVGPVGSPILEGVCAWFDCSIDRVIEAGDHVILLGEVKRFEATPLAGLGYARGAYFTLGAQSEMMQARPDLVVNALIEQAGELLLVENEAGELALPSAPVDQRGTVAAIQTLLEDLEIQAEPGFVYSVYDDREQACQYLVFLCQFDAGTPSTGAFYPSSARVFEKVVDGAQRAVLERFCDEKRFGNFGVYVGNKEEGHVRIIETGITTSPD